MIEPLLLDKLIEERKELWVKLFDGLKICLLKRNPDKENYFIGKVFPCAKNAREYSIAARDVVEVMDANTKARVSKTTE